MARERDARPTAVGVIGWSWVVLGTLMVLGGGLGLAMAWLMSELGISAQSLNTTGLGGLGLSGWVARHLVPMSMWQGVIGAVVLYIAIMFLRLRPWARTVLEVLTWVTLAYTVGSGLYFAYVWLANGAERAELARQMGITTDLRTIGIVTDAVVTVVFAVPTYLMARYLRAGPVREAFLGRSESER
jgi:hypothetical protein